ncbi:MAG: R3H domain-containing nucleic acid-binding protein [Pseudomonadota bacterium]
MEIEGRSKDDALERACNALNATLPYLEYRVVGGNGTKIRARKLENPRTPETAPRTEAAPVAEGTEPVETADGAEGAEVRHEAGPPPTPLAEPSELGLKAKEVLLGILKHIDESAQVEIHETTEEVDLEILGNGSGLFIGKRGATLEALQHLVAKMLGLDRRSGKRILVDSEKYRARRQEALEALAHNVAKRALRERRPISVEPMNAVDRRILHMALKEDRDVTTKSVGEGAGRKVVVVPRNFTGNVDENSGRTDDQGPSRRRGPRGPRRDGGPEQRGGNRRSASSAARPPRKRPEGPARMHDSFDVPSVPDDMFESDEDVLAFHEENEEGTPPETTEPIEPTQTTEEQESSESPDTQEKER